MRGGKKEEKYGVKFVIEYEVFDWMRTMWLNVKYKLQFKICDWMWSMWLSVSFCNFGMLFHACPVTILSGQRSPRLLFFLLYISIFSIFSVIEECFDFKNSLYISTTQPHNHTKSFYGRGVWKQKRFCTLYFITWLLQVLFWILLKL